MSKKFSIRDWTYPDGDPVEQYDKRVLEKVCTPSPAKVNEELPRFDHTLIFNLVSWQWSFLGYIHDFDLWFASPYAAADTCVVAHVHTSTGRRLTWHIDEIDNLSGSLSKDLLKEAVKRAVEKGLCPPL